MQEIKQLVIQVVSRLYGGVEVDIVLTRPEASFGDFATNVAMQLAKPLGKNPREIGEAIASELNNSGGLITSASVAGPGFINITVNNEYYQNTINDVFESGNEYGSNNSNSGKVILAEYSDPNPLKPLHAGHLYTTLVGDSISRVLEATGADVKRINYGGDVGPHVAKSMWAITKDVGEDIEKLKEVPEDERPNWLGQHYVAGNTAYEQDPSAKAQIDELNKKVYELHKTGDKESPFAQIYYTVRQWSYDAFNKMYKELGVKDFDRVIPESEVFEPGLKAVEEHIPQVYQESEGAVIFKGEEYGLHTRVFINSLGLPTYETKDVGLLYVKWDAYKFDESIVITANEQAQYYEVMLKSVEQFDQRLAKRSKHLTHGTLKLAGGKKMSSRKGNVLTAIDVIESAEQANKEVTGKDDKAAVLAAIKYSFLKQRIGGDIIYDPQESVNVLGNSGPYLQYSLVRAKSILAKAGAYEKQALTPAGDEKLVVRKLDEFPQIVSQAAAELSPHVVCTYLYELAQELNRFYENNKVIGSERQTERLNLLAAYVQVFSNGLDLLGIDKPERM